MTYCLAASLSSYLNAWGPDYTITESTEDMINTEEDYNKMLAVIRAQGLEEKVDGEVHRWFGSREEILRMVDAIEFSTHDGPSWEGYDDEMLQILIDRSLDADSDELPYTVYEV